MDYPVAMYQVSKSGKILKIHDALSFASLVAAIFDRDGREMPKWDELTVDQFEQHVKLLREKLR